MRTPLIAGNWKMHKTLAEARELVAGIRDGLTKSLSRNALTLPSPPLGERGNGIGTGIRGVEVLICPPVQLLFPMAKAVAGTKIMLGAQNAHEATHGAFTGEVSVPMLADTGCTHVIIGHSERRQTYKEDGLLLAKKVRAVVGGGLTVIYCVGEMLDERESGRTQAVVERQLAEVVKPDVPPGRLIIAYEPVWAIGTGRTATPDQAQQVHTLIRTRLAAVYGRIAADAIRILYGGSVKPDNAPGLLSKPEIDGALVGGACLVPADFLAIISAAQTGRM